jgi:tRNA(fMet)-specific endonuclease VapC
MSQYALDTDTLTLLLHGQANVTRQAAAHDPADLAVPIVSVEEILTGWYTQIRQSKSDDQLARAYAALQQAVEFTSSTRILPYDRDAIQRFRQLRASKPRIGVNDLKIAAIALEQGAVLVTRNVQDFGQLPGLQLEDWS